MIVYFIEPNLKCLLTAIFTSYQNKETPNKLIADDNFQPDFESIIKKIQPIDEKAQRVKNALIKYGNLTALFDINTVLLSCNSEKYTICFNYIKLFIENKQDVSKMFFNPNVIKFNELKLKVSWEVHRLEGLLRFLETNNNVLYAHYSPDNDITKLLTPHFIARLNRPFIIHDVNRNFFALYNGKQTKYITYNQPINITLSNNETNIKTLWKKYFESINIKERPHKKQQLGYMPKRYWKHLTEYENTTK